MFFPLAFNAFLEGEWKEEVIENSHKFRCIITGEVLHYLFFMFLPLIGSLWKFLEKNFRFYDFILITYFWKIFKTLWNSHFEFHNPKLLQNSKCHSKNSENSLIHHKNQLKFNVFHVNSQNMHTKNFWNP